MSKSHYAERGEGKIGCVFTLLILVSLVAAGLKIVPVFYSNSSLEDAAKEAAGQAALYTIPALEAKLRSQAADMGIPEAGAKGAVKVTISGDRNAGMCTISLNYTRVVDLYGVYTLEIPTHKVITLPYLDAR